MRPKKRALFISTLVGHVIRSDDRPTSFEIRRKRLGTPVACLCNQTPAPRAKVQSASYSFFKISRFQIHSLVHLWFALLQSFFADVQSDDLKKRRRFVLFLSFIISLRKLFVIQITELDTKTWRQRQRQRNRSKMASESFKRKSKSSFFEKRSGKQTPNFCHVHLLWFISFHFN